MSQLLPVICRYCNESTCIKKGYYKSVRKLYCKACNKYQREKYCYRLTTLTDDLNITQLNKEGMGISSMSRYLQIAKTTVRRRILLVSNKLKPKEISEANQIYEVYEMQTFIGRNHPSSYAYITYAINRATGNRLYSWQKIKRNDRESYSKATFIITQENLY